MRIKKTKIILLLFFIAFIIPAKFLAADNLSRQLAGKILLQVESRGEAWYVNPGDLKRYYLGRPEDAINLMRRLGIGITNVDLNKLDRTLAFAKLHSGKIFLQIESKGEAWYVYPGDYKRYYLGRPSDALSIMKRLGLGITNENLNKIISATITTVTPGVVPSPGPAPLPPPADTMTLAANAIRSKNANQAASYFTADMTKRVKYAIENMSAESLLMLGNILSGSRLTSSTASEKIYSNSVYFSLGGQYIPLTFRLKKQLDGNWLISNL